jgi:hypothetical protein
LIELYEAWNNPEKAEDWQAKQAQTKTAITVSGGFENPG